LSSAPPLHSRHTIIIIIIIIINRFV